MASKSHVKDPNDVMDYGFDWSAWLNAHTPDDTISTSAWSVETGDGALTVDSVIAPSSGVTGVWLSAGTSGQTYRVRNRIVTAGGRTKDQSLTIRVQTA